jgi:hypothetical protein
MIAAAHGWTFAIVNGPMPRRRVLTHAVFSPVTVTVGLSLPTNAMSFSGDAASSPSQAGPGTVQALLPIIGMAQLLSESKSCLSGNTKIRKSLLESIPENENDFKKVFDAYSTPVSYKQKFLNANAFLVYYTKGYDGPNRPNIEDLSKGERLQEEQYGSRNDCWVAWNELLSELEYSAKAGDSSELEKLLENTIAAFDTYINLAPNSVVARKVWTEQRKKGTC